MWDKRPPVGVLPIDIFRPYFKINFKCIKIYYYNNRKKLEI